MLASFDLSRAPLLVVLGLALVIGTWHLINRNPGGGHRLMMTGALLLGIGYVVLLPLQESGLLAAGGQGHGHESVIHSTAWQLVRLVVMNLGWLLLGGGLALHARSNRTLLRNDNPQPKDSHESIA
ncbi:MAG: hypothetical protein K9N23_08480 [Akkermansiaceae bacterium]|nr:hypothetical protein [Akkermansiaceae bacterium]MCF7731711.1 hypothetical protein [Akkermansiaceae bacterium]